MSEEILIQISEELKEIKTLSSDIPLIRQAVLETRDDVRQLEAVQRHLITEHHTLTHHFKSINNSLITLLKSTI
ncbi:hypothetical protein [Paenibacillus qinlingensis]|uniref:hypothetical protein n=1 Tax=Paenibacillus qinlingensis TaxID=1837343 RepID=UPI001563DB60|nr:hypothetical protein [Paenibacillus qinlingensis]NQX60231.1 hypothetical protein [Paenibacillus qinlingensis]